MDLQTLKNNYAQEQGYEDWDDFSSNPWLETEGMEGAMNEICIRAQKAALEKAAENLMFKTVNDRFAVIDRKSITNPENLIL